MDVIKTLTDAINALINALKALVEPVKQVIGKIVGLAGTATIYAILEAYTTDPSVGISVLLAVGAYAMWTKGIVPVIDAILLSLLPKAKGTAVKAEVVANYVKLI